MNRAGPAGDGAASGDREGNRMEEAKTGRFERMAGKPRRTEEINRRIEKGQLVTAQSVAITR